MIDKGIVGVARGDVFSLENAVIAHRAAVNSRIVGDNQLSRRVFSIADNKSFSIIAVTGRAVVQHVNSELAIFDNHLTTGTAESGIRRGYSNV